LEEEFNNEFERMQKEESLIVNVDSNNVPLSPAHFTEYWRIQIWAHGFSSLS